MRKVEYYVAISLDGFISAPDGDISGFAQESDGVAKYLDDLNDFDTVIMGRKTYEFGYAFGLQPGKRAYPHMRHFIFSDTLTFEGESEVTVCPIDIKLVRDLKQEAEDTSIYLCGGGQFAAWLLEHQLIDVLKVKIIPMVLGEGVPLFGTSKKFHQLNLTSLETYSHGLMIATYDVVY